MAIWLTDWTPQRDVLGRALIECFLDKTLELVAVNCPGNLIIPESLAFYWNGVIKMYGFSVLCCKHHFLLDNNCCLNPYLMRFSRPARSFKLRRLLLLICMSLITIMDCCHLRFVISFFPICGLNKRKRSWLLETFHKLAFIFLQTRSEIALSWSSDLVLRSHHVAGMQNLTTDWPWRVWVQDYWLINATESLLFWRLEC